MNNKARNANKRYNKCRYECSLKHLKSLYTFVLVDSWATIYSRTCHSVGTLWARLRNSTADRHEYRQYGLTLLDGQSWRHK